MNDRERLAELEKQIAVLTVRRDALILLYARRAAGAMQNQTDSLEQQEP